MVSDSGKNFSKKGGNYSDWSPAEEIFEQRREIYQNIC